MNKFEFNIYQKEENIEELFSKIWKLNPNNVNISINEVKNVFIQIQNKYKYYNNKLIDSKEYIRNRLNEILKEKNSKYNFQA